MEHVVAEPTLGDHMVKGLDVWAAPLMDKTGALAEKLNALKAAGADLEFIIARRSPERPGGGVVFVAPVRGDREIEAAITAGFDVTRSLHVIRVEGPDRPGLAADLTQSLAEADISLRGFSAAVAGTRFIGYVAVDSLADKDRAIEILTAV